METAEENRSQRMKFLFLLAATLSLAFCDHDEETCTEVIVTGDDGTATCTCTCVCEIDCDEPLSPPPPPPPPTPSPTTTSSPMTCCTAGSSAPNIVLTYDGRNFTLMTHNKLRFSHWGSGRDQCKFKVWLDTFLNADGNLQVDWCGVAFGVHQTNEDKHERNVRVSLIQGEVDIRGRATAPPPLFNDGIYAAQTEPWPEPWIMTVDTRDPGKFHIHMEVPSLGCAVDVFYWEGTGSHGKDVLQVCPNDYYGVPGLTQMCGDRNGDPANDDQFCQCLGDFCPYFSDECIEAVI